MSMLTAQHGHWERQSDGAHGRRHQQGEAKRYGDRGNEVPLLEKHGQRRKDK